tara:strand:- start:4320 stop:5450 length:1131 start_codon:yes stop_codon:yes gene_type:complete
MADAPQLNGQAGDLIAVLDACLINGFGTAAPDGDKITISNGVATVHFSGGNDFEKHAVIEIAGATPAALNDVWRVTGATATTFTFDCPGIPDGNASGSISVKRATPGYWEKPYGDALKGAYRSTHPEATGIFLQVDHSSSSGTVPVRAYETMTGIDTGDNPIPTFDQQATMVWVAVHMSSSAYLPNPWAIVADERWIFFLPLWNDSNGCQPFQFGDFNKFGASDFYNLAFTAYRSKSSYPQNSGQQHQIGNNYANGTYLARGLPGILAGPVPYYRLGPEVSNAIAGDRPYPHPATGGHLFFGPLVVYDGSTERGTVPGLYTSPNDDTALGPNASFGLFEAIDPIEATDPAMLLVALPQVSYNKKGVAGFDIWGPWR